MHIERVITMLEKKTRFKSLKINGTESVRIGIGTAPIVFSYNGVIKSFKQETWSEEHGFHRYLKEHRAFEKAFRQRVFIPRKAREKANPYAKSGFIPDPLRTTPDVGGPFLTTKNHYKDGSISVGLVSGTNTSSVQRWYNGSLVAFSQTSPDYPPISPISDDLLHAYGNKASHLVNPVNPVTSFGQDIGELRETSGVPGIPGAALLKERINFLKGLSSEYLNVQFGWLPLLSDIRSAAQSVKDTISILEHYEERRGESIRRRFSFPTVIDNPVETFVSNKTPSPPINSAFYNTYNGKLTKMASRSEDVSFAGAFTYYVTPGIQPDRLNAYRRAADRLLDTDLTPELLWQLSPWSWLTDWFFDFDALLGNLQNLVLDGSVMWYGYVMCHQKATYLYQLSGYSLKNHDSPVLFQEFNTEIKQRVRATPFGFGLSPNAFSMKQWSILAALGITRVL